LKARNGAVEKENAELVAIIEKRDKEDAIASHSFGKEYASREAENSDGSVDVINRLRRN
jgi:hypothetical protein